jgi:hypothetical protein
MKNIHVIPTEKPSRLHFDDKLFLSTNPQISKDINSIVEGRNIYITSNEEIKEGDWVISNYGELIKISYKGSKVKQNVNEFCKKIILTTDQDLIKDGVQDIDDDFLEWFVKNPSCENVDISKHYDKVDIDGKVYYKITIPQEKPTLEEVAVNCWATGTWDNRDDFTDGFIEGAKWQAERMYSEEEVLEVFENFKMDLPFHYEFLLKEHLQQLKQQEQ